MRSCLRGRGPWALGAAVLRLGLIGLATLPCAAAAGCGRIGYDALPEEAHSSDGAPQRPDATQESGGGGVAEASDAPAAEAGGDATLMDGTPGLDAIAGDESLDAYLDASADVTCVMTAPVDYCQTIPPLPAPPVIDGVLDCGPTPVAITPEDWRGAAPLPPFPSGNTSTVAAAWRPDGLYIFMSITTPAAFPAELSTDTYKGAGVEIFVDDDGLFATPGRYDDPGSFQVIVPSPPLTSAPPVCPSDAAADAPDAPLEASSDAAGEAGEASSDASDSAPDATWNGPRAAIYVNESLRGQWMSSQFGTFPTASGFVFEAFVTASDLGLASWSLAAGSTVGFDVAVDVSFPDYCTVGLEGHRAGQYFLHVGTNPADADASPIDAPFADSRSFCTPTLTP